MITPELIKYIRSQKGNNISDVLIKEDLLEKGWSPENIDVAFEQAKNGIEASNPIDSKETKGITVEDGNMSYEMEIQPEGIISKKGRTEGIFGIICAIISLIFLPPIFGVTGIILGIVSKNKGQKAFGVTTITLSSVFMVIGMILSYIVKSK